MSTRTNTQAPERIGINEAARILKRGPNVIYRYAVLGRIEVYLEPGLTPRYCRADVERLAAEFEGRSK